MTTTLYKLITLEEFLKLPETKPASEFINGRIYQKPMPQGKHSRIQLKLCDAAISFSSYKIYIYTTDGIPKFFLNIRYNNYQNEKLVIEQSRHTS